MGGGGGSAPGSRRDRSGPGQVNVAVNTTGNTPSSRPPTDTDRVRTASSSGNTSNTPAPPAAPFPGNLEHLTRTIVSPGGDHTAPSRDPAWPNEYFQIRTPTGGTPPTDYVRDAVDPYPSQPPTFFGTPGA